MVLTPRVRPDPDVAPAPALALDHAHACAHGAQEEIVRADAPGYHLDREGRPVRHPADLEPDPLACLALERPDRIEGRAIGRDDLVPDQQSGAGRRSAVVNAGQEHPAVDGPRGHPDAGISHAPAGEQGTQARGLNRRARRCEQLVVGEFPRRVALGVGSAERGEGGIQRRGDFLAGGAARQRRAVRCARL